MLKLTMYAPVFTFHFCPKWCLTFICYRFKIVWFWLLLFESLGLLELPILHKKAFSLVLSPSLCLYNLFNFLIWGNWESHAAIQKQFRKILYIHHPASPSVNILVNYSIISGLENWHWMQFIDLMQISSV